MKVAAEITPLELEQKLNDVTNYIRHPLVIRGLTDFWPIVQTAKQGDLALRKYILEHSNSVRVGTGTVQSKDKGRLFYNERLDGFNFERKSQDFHSFVKQVFEQSADSHYMGSTNVSHLFKRFKQDNPFPLLAHLSPLVSAWLSNKTKIAAHQDFPDNLAICVAGKRRFTLFPPEQVDNLYIGPLDNTPAGQPISLVNIDQPDFRQHPKYKTAIANAIVVDLEPGDALLIPSLWWHAVEGQEQVNMLINYWWQTSPNYLGSPMDALIHSIMNISALEPEKKRAMKALFEHYVFNDSDPNEHIPKQAQGILANDENAVRKIRSYLINKLNQ